MSLISFGEAKHHVYQDKNQDDFICIRFMCHLNHEQNNHYAKNQKFSNGVLFHINLPLEFRFVWLFIFLNYIIASFCSNRKAKLKSDFSTNGCTFTAFHQLVVLPEIFIILAHFGNFFRHNKDWLIFSQVLKTMPVMLRFWQNSANFLWMPLASWEPISFLNLTTLFWKSSP